MTKLSIFVGIASFRSNCVDCEDCATAVIEVFSVITDDDTDKALVPVKMRMDRSQIAATLAGILNKSSKSHVAKERH